MDYQGALKFLGLSENASSEDMVKAKNQMTTRYGDQDEKLKMVRHPSRPRAGCRVFSRSDPCAALTLTSSIPSIPTGRGRVRRRPHEEPHEALAG
jgi:hypothetical protein